MSMAFSQSTDTLMVKSPKKAALWSIFPGGGQIYNGKYFKAGVLITLESLAIWQSIENGGNYDRTGEENYLNDRNKFAWWSLFFHVYGTLDAVVDSHLKPFNEIMDEEIIKKENDIEEELTDGE